MRTVLSAVRSAPQAPTEVVRLAARRRPAGVSPEDNELGWRMSMDQLAALVETGRSVARQRP